MQDFKHDLTSMGDECNCPEVWTFFRTTLLGNWNEDWPLPVLWNNVPYDSAESLTFLVGLGCCNKIHRLSGFYNRFFFLIAFFFPLWTLKFQKNTYFCFIDYAKAFHCVDHSKLRKILQELGISDHLTCLLRNLYAGQKATVRTRHGTTNWFKIGKWVYQGCILSPCFFNLYAEYIM